MPDILVGCVLNFVALAAGSVLGYMVPKRWVNPNLGTLGTK